MAFTKDSEEAAIIALKDALDSGVAFGRQIGGVESVARGKAMLHALAHGLELGRHEATGLGRRQTKRVFILSCIEVQQRSGRHRSRKCAKDGT